VPRDITVGAQAKSNNMPPATTTLLLPDGDTLAYVETGDSSGLPVLVFHGLPGSRLQRHPDETIARAAGLRLIHFDRPGYGLSSPRPGRTLSDWPRTIAAAADAIGLAEFAIAGISGGGPYAAACVTSLRERVIRAAIISGVGPPGSMSGRMTVAPPGLPSLPRRGCRGCFGRVLLRRRISRCGRRSIS
jgi:pimeloyl-ACP methyl ester carboxylesterase